MNYSTLQQIKEGSITCARTSNLLQYDPIEVYSSAKETGLMLEPEFQIDDHYQKALEVLSLYFANNPRFETEGHGKLHKGLYILGPTGSGKTLLMKCFIDNPKQRYSIVGVNKIVDSYMRAGIEAIEQYFLSGGMLSKKQSLVFDDLGSENSTVKYMGSEINAMERIILDRYESNQPFYMTHFTSNVDGKGIEESYGPRVRSRLKEMVNVIKLLGDDRRSKK